MNLLEHYIKEIISEDFEFKYGKNWVKAKMVIDCYGVTEETTQLFTCDDWRKIKEQGYYMG